MSMLRIKFIIKLKYTKYFMSIKIGNYVTNLSMFYTGKKCLRFCVLTDKTSLVVTQL